MKTFAVPGGVFSMASVNQTLMRMYIEHKDWFNDNINLIPYDTFGGVWSGGRVQFSLLDEETIEKLLYFFNVELKIPYRQIYTNLYAGHYLNDKYCNMVIDLMYKSQKNTGICNEIVIGDNRLYDYLKPKYPDFRYISSVTKALLDMDVVNRELKTTTYDLICLWCSFNDINILKQFNESDRKRLELLIVQPCKPDCRYVGIHNTYVSGDILGEFAKANMIEPPTLPNLNFKCPFYNVLTSDDLLDLPWVFSQEQLDELYNLGYSDFKITGRNVTGQLYKTQLEIWAYYLIKPEHYDDYFNVVIPQISVNVETLYGSHISNVKDKESLFKISKYSELSDTDKAKLEKILC